MLWQGIHFLNAFSPAAISPATAVPAEDASATIAIQTLFIILRDPYSARPVLLALTLRLSRKLIRSEPGTLCARGPTKYTISGEFDSRWGGGGWRRRGIPTFFGGFEGPLQPPPLSAHARR